MFGRKRADRGARKAAEAQREAEQQLLLAALADRPDTVCPFLGTDAARADFRPEPMEAHRCYAFGDAAPLSFEQQGRVCLQRGYGNCPRYLRGLLVIPTDEMEAIRRRKAEQSIKRDAPAPPPAASPKAPPAVPPAPRTAPRPLAYEETLVTLPAPVTQPAPPPSPASAEPVVAESPAPAKPEKRKKPEKTEKPPRAARQRKQRPPREPWRRKPQPVQVGRMRMLVAPEPAHHRMLVALADTPAGGHFRPRRFAAMAAAAVVLALALVAGGGVVALGQLRGGTIAAEPAPSVAPLAPTPSPSPLAKPLYEAVPKPDPEPTRAPRPTPEPTLEPLATETPEPEITRTPDPTSGTWTYVVQDYDTISLIAQRYGTTTETLLDLNPQYRDDPNHVVRGDLVIVPCTQAAVREGRCP